MNRDYILLSYLIYNHNKSLYSKLNFSWSKNLVLKEMISKIPDLKTSYVKPLSKLEDIDENLNTFVVKGSFGDSADNVYVFMRKSKNIYYELNRKQLFMRGDIGRIIKKLRDPFLEKTRGTSKLPYDIKVHVFFGRICFFYIYDKNKKLKARFDINKNYIDINKMFVVDYFWRKGFREKRTLVNEIDQESLDYIFKKSIEIFDNLPKMFYSSIDWLYDPDAKSCSFCELSPTPFCLKFPIKSSFIRKYILEKNQTLNT